MVRSKSERRGESGAVLYGTRVGGGTHLKSIAQCDQNDRYAASSNGLSKFVERRGHTARHYIEQERGCGFRHSMVRQDLERRAVQSRSYYREQVGSAGVISSAMCRCNGSQIPTSMATVLLS